jgi:hypothetical protein
VRLGLPEPFLVATDAHCPGLDCRRLGFDETLQFSPQLAVLPHYQDEGPRWGKLRRNLQFGAANASLRIYDYSEAQQALAARQLPHPAMPCVMVRWDNTPRRGRQAIVITKADPAVFEHALAEAIERVQGQPPEERVVFVNAWNEWAEGNHLEPDLRHGHGFLEAVRRANQTTRPEPAAAR